MDSTAQVTSLSNVPDASTFVFRVRERVADAEPEEAILVRTDDSVRCWLNYCQHMIHIKLDKGTGATVRNGEIVCENHGAYFESETGKCTFGPCEGAYLTELEVTVRDGDVYLVDESYEFLDTGPIPDDDVDRSSSSNLKI